MKTFEELFWPVFESLPAVDRADIKLYWTEWGAEVDIVTDSELTKRYCRKRILAHTRGKGEMECLSVFYFRDFIVGYAPEKVRISLILHELAHCKLHATSSIYKTPKLYAQYQQVIKTLQNIGIPNRTQNELDRIAAARDEQKAAALSQSWGADEKEVDEWALRFLNEHSEYEV